MHSLFRLGILGTLVTAAAVVPIDEPLRATIDSDMIGPFDEFQSNQTIEFTYKLNKRNAEVNEELRVYNARSGDQVSKDLTATHTVMSKPYTVSFNLLLKKFFGPDGLTIKFSVISKGTTASTRSVTIYPRKKETINLKETNTTRVQSNIVSFAIINGETVTYHDDFNFVGFKDYVNADNYYSLDLSENVFLYNRSTLNCKSAVLRIWDMKNILKTLPHDGNAVNVPLEIVNNGEKKSFKYKNIFYVNRLNLETLNYEFQNYVETDKLFLPVNKKKDFLGTYMEILLYDCGLNNYDLQFQLTYDVFRELLGSCDKSDYCIKGEVD